MPGKRLMLAVVSGGRSLMTAQNTPSCVTASMKPVKSTGFTT